MIKPIINATIIILLIALLPLPYGFYTIVRILGFISCGFVAYQAYLEKKEILFSVFFILSIIYNPIFKVYLNKDIWTVINIATALLLFIGKKRVLTVFS